MQAHGKRQGVSNTTNRLHYAYIKPGDQYRWVKNCWIKNGIETYHYGAKPGATKAGKRRLCRAINRQDTILIAGLIILLLKLMEAV